MSTNVFFAGAPVRNYETACAWYARLFDRPPDMIPNEIEDVPGNYRKVSYRDPDGNMIAFGSVYPA